MIFFGENSSGIYRLPSAAKIEIDSEVGVAAIVEDIWVQ